MHKLLAKCGVCLVFVAAISSGQTQPEPQNDWHEIDGAKDPASIPDIEAWKILLLRLSDTPRGPSRLDRVGYVSPAGLSEADTNAVISVANAHLLVVQDVVRRFMVLKRTIRGEWTSADRYRVKVLFETIDMDVAGRQKALQDQLSPEAYSRLLRFVDTVVKPSTIVSIHR